MGDSLVSERRLYGSITSVSERLSRQGVLGPNSDTILRSLRIGVVGVGGGGSHIAQQLAHIGVGHFVLIDPDVVEESNLNRLVGATVDDARRRTPKVTVARRMIRRVAPDTVVEARKATWQRDALRLRDCDAIFGCVDSFAARDELERMARRYLVPYFDIGMDVHVQPDGYAITGQVAASIPGMPCLRCMTVLTPKLIANEAAQYGKAGPRPQVIWPNGVLASTAVALLIQLVTPWSRTADTPVIVEYDGNRHELRWGAANSFLTSAKCPHFDALEDLGDPWFEAKKLQPRSRSRPTGERTSE